MPIPLAKLREMVFMHLIDRLAGHAMSVYTRSSALVSGAFDFSGSLPVLN